MVNTALGKLERIALRDVWENEAYDFTPWLGHADNIALLGETIGLDLEVEAQEKQVGPFRADILCRETTTGSWVLIENQLERTDHGHLGQLITYAAGLEAVTVVWIAERFTEEHRAALDWLNEIASEKLRCFGIEMEVWRIGESLPAPKFNIVSKPNDWARTVVNSAGRLAGELTPTQQLQLDYWTSFAQFLHDAKSPLKPQKPFPQNFSNFALGRTGIYLTAIASTWDSSKNAYDGGENRAQLTIDRPGASKLFFKQLEAQKAEIETEVGEPLTWYDPPDRRVSTISLRRSIDLEDRASWPEQHEWLRQKLELLGKVLGPRVKVLQAEPSVGSSPESSPAA